ncbi:MAG: hypothetical protein HYR77_04585 [Ignavibacteria bacterium]|nr:hypothetical protein [Ignavibacteria bacterium]
MNKKRRLILAVTAVFVTCVALISHLSADQPKAIREIQNEGDITINATSEIVDCAACNDPNNTHGVGKGRKICYEVFLSPNAQVGNNDWIRDFHVRVTDGIVANFQCATVERWNPQMAKWEEPSFNNPPPQDPDKWAFSHDSQNEGLPPNVSNVHYINWHSTGGTNNGLSDAALAIHKGDRFRFCFVYCGPNNNLGSKIRFICTDDARTLPGPPQGGMARRNGVPHNQMNPDDPDKNLDDPAWDGRVEKQGGDLVGFNVSYDDDPIVPTFTQWGIVILSSLLAVTGIWIARKRRTQATT